MKLLMHAIESFSDLGWTPDLDISETPDLAQANARTGFQDIALANDPDSMQGQRLDIRKVYAPAPARMVLGSNETGRVENC